MKDDLSHVWLFGSHARGSHDPESDVDILIVTRTGTAARKHIQEVLPADIRSKNIDYSIYSKERILNLIDEGALFAWHLRDEGISIYDSSSWLRQKLGEIAPYSKHLSDIALLQEVLFDILNDNGNLKDKSVHYDAGVIGTIVRNVAIIATNKLGKTDYSNQAPYSLTKYLPMRPFDDMSTYDLMIQCRRNSERGSTRSPARITYSQLLDSAIMARRWIDSVIKEISV